MKYQSHSGYWLPGLLKCSSLFKEKSAFSFAHFMSSPYYFQHLHSDFLAFKIPTWKAYGTSYCGQISTIAVYISASLCGIVLIHNGKPLMFKFPCGGLQATGQLPATFPTLRMTEK